MEHVYCVVQNYSRRRRLICDAWQHIVELRLRQLFGEAPNQIRKFWIDIILLLFHVFGIVSAERS